MRIAELAIQNRVATLFLTVLILIMGTMAFYKLGRLEDPEFTIKDALIITPYPGATALEVEQEVTDRVEIATQQLSQLKRIESLSKPGISIITAKIKDKYGKNALPQVWDELRRKINDMQTKLPPGAGPSIVNDDYGDVYGILLALNGKAFNYKELEETADFLRRELLLVKDVGKVVIFGVQPQQVQVEITRDKLANAKISLNSIYASLARQNIVLQSGSVRVGDEYINIRPTGNFKALEEIGDILIGGAGTGKLIYLKDIATIKHGYQTPPPNLIRHNGNVSLAIGVSIASGGNVVELGNLVKQKIAALKSQIPLGIKLDVISFQPDSVTASIDNFTISLVEALIIVIVVLMIFMGLRSGLLIGLVLLITVLVTFIGMEIWGINLERISLGALIIALGMLVDNAIVVTDGILVRIQQGADLNKAAKDVVAQTALPLLGATFIAVLAFAAIGLSQDNTGEYTRSLFQVILISLMMSWVIAITITPLLCVMMLKSDKANAAAETDPYQGKFYLAYRSLLSACMRARWLTVSLLVISMVLAIYAFNKLEDSFFPDSTRPQFMVHFWLPEGTDIRKTSDDLAKLEKTILKMKGVTGVSTFVGGGAPRFILTYTPEKEYSSYGIMLVDVDNYRSIDGLMAQITNYANDNYINAMVKTRRFMLGPGTEDTLEARFSGPDPTILRELANHAKAIFYQDGGIVGIKDNWRERVKIIRPTIATYQARDAGISKADVDNTLQTIYGGKSIGIYRENDKLLPIVSQAPEEERTDVANIKDVQIWSPLAQSTIPLRQIVDNFETSWEDTAIQRRDRKRTITVAGSQRTGNASVAFARVQPKIEAMKLPVGYEFAWGGQYENSRDAQIALFKNIPMTMALVVVVLVLLFNAIRQPLIIILTVPLAVIGVAMGLTLTNQPFGFMALLGFLSLSGMLIKNAIVLIDQIDLEIRAGKPHWNAILDSSAARMRPVAMAAVTTVLGMIPLLTDIFFVGMAVTIMAGLTVATVLTLVVVPVLYAIFFRVKSQ